MQTSAVFLLKMDDDGKFLANYIWFGASSFETVNLDIRRISMMTIVATQTISPNKRLKEN